MPNDKGFHDTRQPSEIADNIANIKKLREAKARIKELEGTIGLFITTPETLRLDSATDAAIIKFLTRAAKRILEKKNAKT